MSGIDNAIETLKNINMVTARQNSKCSFSEAMIQGIIALQEKMERENPQPLTLKDLETMVGKPLWLDTGEILINEQMVGCYEILDMVTQEPTKEFWFTHSIRGFLAENYSKTWLVYRCMPEEYKESMN